MCFLQEFYRIIKHVKSSRMIAVFGGILVCMQIGLCEYSIANPLTGNPLEPQKTVAVTRQPSSTFFSDLVRTVTIWQMQLKQKMSHHVRLFKKEGKIRPLLPLFLLAFTYGSIHAAGPGHGKGIAMAYVLAQGRSYSTGILLGSLIALVHAGSAILLVIILRFALERALSSNLDAVSHITQIVSYGLITLIGFIIFLTSLPDWFNKKTAYPAENKNKIYKIASNPFTAALAIGVVPCPGVIMILLFCLSLEQMVLGLLLAFIVSCGMALTITVAVWVSVAGKKAALHVSSKWGSGLSYADRFLHSFSGLLLTAIGGIFLAASL